MKKRAGEANYRQIIKSNGVRDWAPVNDPKRASSTAPGASRYDLSQDFSSQEDTGDEDYYNEYDEYDDIDVDTDDLLNEDLEDGLDEIIEKESGSVSRRDDSYAEGFGEYGDLSEHSSFDNGYDLDYRERSVDDYFGYNDEWN